MNTTTRTINASPTCDCGRSKSPRYPVCRKCHLDRRAAKALAEPIWYKRLTTRAEEGRQWMSELHARFSEYERRPHSHFIEDTRGIEESKAASEHTGEIGDYGFGRTVDLSHQHHIPGLGSFGEVPLSHCVLTDLNLHRSHDRITRADRKRTKRSDIPWPKRYRISNDLTDSYDPTAAEFDREYGRLALICESDIPALYRKINRSVNVADVAAMQQEILSLRQRRDDALRRARKGPHTVEFYIDRDPCMPSDEDLRIRSITPSDDFIRSRLHDATIHDAHLDRIVTHLPSSPTEGRVEDLADAWTEALLEAELRADYPDLFIPIIPDREEEDRPYEEDMPEYVLTSIPLPDEPPF